MIRYLFCLQEEVINKIRRLVRILRRIFRWLMSYAVLSTLLHKMAATTINSIRLVQYKHCAYTILKLTISSRASVTWWHDGKFLFVVTYANVKYVVNILRQTSSCLTVKTFSDVFAYLNYMKLFALKIINFRKCL